MNYITLQYENIFTILLSLVGLFIVMYAQIKINGNYQKYKLKVNHKKLSGVEVARKILDTNGLDHVHVIEVNGELTDHFDLTRKVIRLSPSIFQGESIASVAVAAHECGHALQDKYGYTFMKIRGFLVPIVTFITYMGYVVTFLSLFFGAIGYLRVGILILLITLIFQIVTLPVEFDASKRAIEQLLKLELIEKNEQDDVREMLSAAAFTYVASLLANVLNLLRLFIMIRNDKDD